MHSSQQNKAIAAVILAAGASTRMGKPKQLLSYQGKSLLRSICEIAIAADCNPVFVVLGAYIGQIREEVLDLPVRIVENRQWQMGMGSSISIGIQAVIDYSPNVEAAILLLCDQPFVSSQLIQQLKSTYYSTHQSIVASTYQNTVGVPALFDTKLFTELINLNGAEGAKKVIKSHSNPVAIVDFPQGAIDLDTPQDYQLLSKSGVKEP